MEDTDSIWLELYKTIVHYGEIVVHTLSQYIDLHYLHWLVWVFYPLMITFLLPVLIMLFLYASALFLHLYRMRHFIKMEEGYTKDKLWDWARRTICALWYAQGKIWHGYELIGIENIPVEGPAVLVYYHGAIPIDFYYTVAKINLERNRQIRAVGDKFLFKIPGFKLMWEVFGILPGTVEDGIKLMEEGHILAIAPGGVREAYFSHNYSLIWGQRTGFAKIALNSKVPIIPMFTQNVREGFRTFTTEWLRKKYEQTRLPIVPIYGMFPVKMRTFIGKPITHDPSLSPDELAAKVKSALEALIAEHQKIPGSIPRALLERIPYFSCFKYKNS